MILGELTTNYMGNKTMICFWVAYNCDYAFKQHGGAPFCNIVHRVRYCIKLCCFFFRLCNQSPPASSWAAARNFINECAGDETRSLGPVTKSPRESCRIRDDIQTNRRLWLNLRMPVRTSDNIISLQVYPRTNASHFIVYIYIYIFILCYIISY